MLSSSSCHHPPRGISLAGSCSCRKIINPERAKLRAEQEQSERGASETRESGWAQRFAAQRKHRRRPADPLPPEWGSRPLPARTGSPRRLPRRRWAAPAHMIPRFRDSPEPRSSVSPPLRGAGIRLGNGPAGAPPAALGVRWVPSPLPERASGKRVAEAGGSVPGISPPEKKTNRRGSEPEGGTCGRAASARASPGGIRRAALVPGFQGHVSPACRLWSGATAADAAGQRRVPSGAVRREAGGQGAQARPEPAAPPPQEPAPRAAARDRPTRGPARPRGSAPGGSRPGREVRPRRGMAPGTRETGFTEPRGTQRARAPRLGCWAVPASPCQQTQAVLTPPAPYWGAWGRNRATGLLETPQDTHQLLTTSLGPAAALQPRTIHEGCTARVPPGPTRPRGAGNSGATAPAHAPSVPTPSVLPTGGTPCRPRSPGTRLAGRDRV